MELEFSRQIFEKSSNTKFRENPSSGSRVVSCGQTHDEADSRFSQFCGGLQKLKDMIPTDDTVSHSVPMAVVVAHNFVTFCVSVGSVHQPCF
jgi:hypothetical protein